MSDEDPVPPRRVKDLLQSGELDAKQTKGDRFGERHMRRHLRRPVGNSEKLWKKVEGEDPWDVPGPPEAPKQRGVYASGRFVRIDESKRTSTKDEASHVPAWAKAAQAKREAARSMSGDDEVKATPTVDDPLARLMQTIAQRNAEVEAQRAKKQDAAERLRKAQQGGAEEGEGSALADIPGATRLGTGASERASVSNAGRIRTSKGGMLKPAEVEKEKPKVDPGQRRMAAGRAPPKAREAPKDIPIEMRRPPRIEHDPNKKKERIDPALRRMAAGRAPPTAREAAKDIPLEMRRPPRIDPNAPAPEAPVEHRMAAGRAPPRPRGPAKDIPLEMRRPPRIGEDGEIVPREAEPPPAPRAATPTLPPASPPPPAASTAPRTGALDKPVNRSPSAGGGGGLDDLFGMAQQEGRVRIGRRTKKTAASSDEGEGKDEG